MQQLGEKEQELKIFSAEIKNDMGAFGSVLGLIGGPVGSGVGSVLDSIFGGGSSEDKSVTGFNNFISSQPPLLTYPSTSELLRVGKAAGWAGDDLAAISSTYNQNNGTFQKGDWHGVVINTSPTQIKYFKGASESFVLNAAASNLAFANSSANNLAEGQSDAASQAQKAAFGGSGQTKTVKNPGASQTKSSGMMIGIIAGAAAVVLGILYLIFKRKR